jgi:Tfp pilus assembly protein PilF
MWILMFIGAPEARGQMVRETRVNIAVHITDQSSGTALEQVKVELVIFPDQVMETTFTDGNGHAEFEHVISQPYLIRTTKPDFVSQQTSFEPLRGQLNVMISIQMQPVGSKPQRPGGAISARELSIPGPARDEYGKGVELLNVKKDPQQSAEHFLKAIDAFSNYYEAYFMLGMAYLQMKPQQPDKAQAALQKAVDLNSKFLDPYFPLSDLLMAGKQFDKAAPLLLAADQQDPTNWRWPFQLAMCYAKQGIWDKALNYGQTALARPNPSTKVHLLIADIYSNSGNPAKAVSELEEFEKLDPKSPYVARIEKVLPELRKQAAATHPANSP